MSVMVTVTDSPEGMNALQAGVAEALRLDTDLIIVNLKLHALDTSSLPQGLVHEVIERRGRSDLADAVIQSLEERKGTVERLVIGVRRRSPVGKAMLGSLSQQLLLEADVPILAVKLPLKA